MGIEGAAIASDIALIFYTGAHLLICRSVIGIRLRSLLGPAVRTAVAALPMAAVLVAFGPGVGVIGIVVGGLAAWAVFLPALVLTGALSRSEVSTALRRVARALPGRGAA